MADLINNFIELNFISASNDISENSKANIQPSLDIEIPTKILILPKSPILGPDGRKFTYNPQEVMEAFINNNLDLPIDFEHESELKANSGQFVPAIDWIKSLEADFEGKIWVNVLWNEEAQAIKARHVSYISPAFLTDKNNKITLLTSVALTNKPNFKLPALNTIKNTGISDTNTLNNQELGATMIKDEDLLKALELPDGSSKDAVLQKLHDLKNQANIKETEKLALELNAISSEFNNYKSSVLALNKSQAIEIAIKNGKIAPSTRDFYLKHLNSMEAVEEFTKTMEKVPNILALNNIQKPLDDKNFGVSLNSEQKKLTTVYFINEKEFAETRNRLFS
ncbi:Mu-like prophage I protein [Candidatus Hepatincolaceae symbiont of Richtersius coronifer]